MTRLAAARLRAADAQPFLALALYALTPVADPGRGTFAVDEEWRIRVDPAALANWSVDECAGVFLHEVGHVVRGHASRARACGISDSTARLWNVAADAEINDDLVDDEVVLPARPVVPATLGEPPHRAAEYYFHRLLSRPRPTPAAPDCGTGCHSRFAPGDSGTVPNGLSEAEAVLLRRRVAEEVLQVDARHPGTIAAGWTRWAESLLRPQLDWRRLLGGAVRGAVAAVNGASDYAYRKPSRRRVPKVVLPSLHRPLPRVAIVVDTSASVDDALLQVAWSEVQGCVRGLGVRPDLLTVYATDTDAHRIDRPRGRLIPLSGGGGTDMARGIAVALAARPRPDFVVVLTDGLTPWPARDPGRPVIVGLLPGEDRLEPPEWARLVRIPPIDLAPGPARRGAAS